MRIALFSDLHADFIASSRYDRTLAAINAGLLAAHVQVLIVAGDLANHWSKVARLLPRVGEGVPHRLYVPGNHDVWLSEEEIRRGVTSYETLDRLNEVSTRAGWVYLPGHPVTIDGWGFAGSLGWYDYTFARLDLGVGDGQYRRKEAAGFVWNDVKFVWWAPRQILRNPDNLSLPDAEVAHRFAQDLEDDLVALEATRAGSPLIAVTHMLPERFLVEYRNEFGWDFFSAFMGSARFGEIYARHPSVRGILAGHTHRARFYEMDDAVRAVAPLGYYGTVEWANDPMSRVKIFDTEGNRLVLVAGEA